MKAWLDRHEPVLRLVFRVAVIALLTLAVRAIDGVDSDITWYLDRIADALRR